MIYHSVGSKIKIPTTVRTLETAILQLLGKAQFALEH